MATNNGKKFEQQIKKSVDKLGILFERFPDSNKFGQGNDRQTRFTLQSPCDCFIFDGYRLYYIELKHTENTSISFNQPPYEKSKNKSLMIKPHQVKSLMERSKYDKVECGLVLDFADRTNSKGEIVQGGTYYIDINTFVGWTMAVPKKSINQKDAEMIGIKINRELLKTNYEYDIKGLLDSI